MKNLLPRLFLKKNKLFLLKRLSLSFVFLTFFIAGYSQVIIEEGFENPDTDCPSPLGTNPFFEGCVDNWISTHGTPSLETNDPYEGDYYAHMYVKWDFFTCYPDYPPYQRGEGIAFEYPFIAGNVYSISYALRLSAGIRTHEIRWILTDGLENDSGFGNGSCSEDLLPDIPTDFYPVHQVNNFSSHDWVTYNNISFTPTENYNQLWFRALNNDSGGDQFFSTVNLDIVTVELVCDNTHKCDEIIDRTACADEGDFGFIILDCEEPGLQYNWSFPTGSTALEVSCENTSTIVQASEGTYSVTITDDNNCTEVRQYEIEADCCNLCPTPENLECQLGHGFAALSWDEICDVEGYNVFIIEDDPDCCGTEFGIIPGPFFTTNPYFNFQLSPGITCISWQVQTVCDQSFGEISDWSEKYCLEPGDCYPAEHFTEEDDSKSNINLEPHVYPNPNYGELNLELEAPGELIITVEIYSLDGKLVKVFDEEQFPDGFYKQSWTVNEQMTDGIYFAIFKTNYGTFQEKIIISKKGHPKN